MHRNTARTLGAAAAVLALTTSGWAGAAAAGATPARAAALAAAVTPRGNLTGVAATSARNAWAVGCTSESCGTGTDGTRLLILHWNGIAWKRQASPRPAGVSALYGVAATSASNAWAVGYTRSPMGRSLILHWNGRAWKRVPSPDPLAGGDWLTAVTALSARSAWAVGYAVPKTGGLQTLIVRWNGRTWKRVPSPDPGGPPDYLSGVAAVSARSAWAVGSYTVDGVTGALAEHWNGVAWRQVPSPGRPNRQAIGIGEFAGVAAASARTAWAVGFADAGPTLAARWTGAAWRRVLSPAPASGGELAGVAAASVVSAWAVGGTGFTEKTLVARWTGRAWQRVPSPTPGGHGVLAGVAATSAASAWAVGRECVKQCPSGIETDVALILHWNGEAWKSVPVHS